MGGIQNICCIFPALYSYWQDLLTYILTFKFYNTDCQMKFVRPTNSNKIPFLLSASSRCQSERLVADVSVVPLSWPSHSHNHPLHRNWFFEWKPWLSELLLEAEIEPKIWDGTKGCIRDKLKGRYATIGITYSYASINVFHYTPQNS